MTAEAMDLLVEMVRSLDKSYKRDRNTPGFLYRKDARNVFDGEEYTITAGPSFGLTRLKLSMSGKKQDDSDFSEVIRQMFYAGYTRLFANEASLQPSDFLTRDFATAAAPGLEDGFDEALREIANKIVHHVCGEESDFNIHFDSDHGAGIWGWALGLRVHHYYAALSKIEEIL